MGRNIRRTMIIVQVSILSMILSIVQGYICDYWCTDIDPTKEPNKKYLSPYCNRLTGECSACFSDNNKKLLLYKNRCLSCDDNCFQCEFKDGKAFCTICRSGTLNKNGKCKQCETIEGQYYDNNAETCLPNNIENCKIQFSYVDGTLTCKECNYGLIFNNSRCEAPQKVCLKQNEDDDTMCEECIPFYYLRNGVCFPNPKNCEYVNIQCGCTVCVPGYFHYITSVIEYAFSDEFCKPCTENCFKCGYPPTYQEKPNFCDTCDEKKGYNALYTTVAASPSKLAFKGCLIGTPNCSKFIDDKCVRCVSTYTLNGDDNTCHSNQEKCALKDVYLRDPCLVCQTGAFLNKWKYCEDCPSHCASCTAPDYCTECSDLAMYADQGQCYPCHPDCRTCYGPGNRCLTCRNEMKPSNGRCKAEPLFRKFTIFERKRYRTHTFIFIYIGFLAVVALFLRVVVSTYYCTLKNNVSKKRNSKFVTRKHMKNTDSSIDPSMRSSAMISEISGVQMNDIELNGLKDSKL